MRRPSGVTRRSPICSSTFCIAKSAVTLHTALAGAPGSPGASFCASLRRHHPSVPSPSSSSSPSSSELEASLSSSSPELLSSAAAAAAAAAAASASACRWARRISCARGDGRGGDGGGLVCVQRTEGRQWQTKVEDKHKAAALLRGDPWPNMQRSRKPAAAVCGTHGAGSRRPAPRAALRCAATTHPPPLSPLLVLRLGSGGPLPVLIFLLILALALSLRAALLLLRMLGWRRGRCCRSTAAPRTAGLFNAALAARWLRPARLSRLGA